MPAERLQKILAHAGIASRRAAEQLILDGKVAVDGKIVTDLGVRADPEKQKITLEGKAVDIAKKKIYLLLNKPKGYVTTMRDPQGRPIVTDLLKDVQERLFPVGRLDLDTEGALLLTNDGDLANRITHPRYEVRKTYIAHVSGIPSRDNLARLEKGIVLEGHRTWPAAIRVIDRKENSTSVEITIHEGKKRQVRKMFAAIGNPVLHLKRIAYGGLRLGSLRSGAYRFLTSGEIAKIFT